MTSLDNRKSNAESKLLGTQKRTAQCRDDTIHEPIPMLKLAPVKNAHIYARRKSAHNAANFKIEIKSIPPPIPLRPSMHTNLGFVPSPPLPKETPKQNSYSPSPIVQPYTSEPRALPPIPTSMHSFITQNKPTTAPTESRRLPPRPPVRTSYAARAATGSSLARKHNNIVANMQVATAFEFESRAATGVFAAGLGRQSTSPSQHNKPSADIGEKNIRHQDSSISSGDSFSQTSSPGYTSKNMETPLLPLITSSKVTGILSKIQKANDVTVNGSTTITKSVSTPASLQTIVRFQRNSNLSLHHRVKKFHPHKNIHEKG